ncbi:MAG: hypothetical protein R3Y28_05155 [Candidatus Gastranaerophilales bacterium]
MKINSQQNNSTSFKGLYNNKAFLKTLEFANDNGALFTASASLALSTIARPIAIMATPNTDEQNKKYACAKSLASSATGYALMFLASVPIAKSVKNINKNPKNFLKKETISNLKEKNKTLQNSDPYKFATQLFKLGIGFAIATPKSILTSNLIPPFMKKVFPEKKQEIHNEKQLSHERFSSFSHMTNNNDKTSFNGKFIQTSTNQLSKGIGKIIDTKFVQNVSKKFSNTNVEQHIISATDALATSTFIYQTSKNKEIEPERKKPLIYNAGISTGLCIASGYGVNKMVEKPFNKFVDKFKEVNKANPKLDSYVSGLKTLKVSMILGTIYYIAIPIVATYFADKVKPEKENKLFV